MTITNKERFLGTSNGHILYAPMTLGAPAYTQSIDRTVFRASKDEKFLRKIAKQEHRQELRKVYGMFWKRFLNVPGKSLKDSIKLSF